MRSRIAIVAALSVLFSGCSAHRFFYFPNRVLYADPAVAKIPHEIVRYPSLNGKNLIGVYFPASEKPKGTVVHFHGNYANVSNHFMQSYYLTQRGFDVLIFDYQGYGGSEGKPTPRRTVEDGIASVRWAQANLREGAAGVVILGQSLGGAVGSVVAAKEPLVRGIVIESAFSSYRSMSRVVLGKNWFLWPLWPFFPLFLGRTYDPVRWVGNISPRPVLFVHGTSDTIVPSKMSEILFEAAKEPKRIIRLTGADHLQLRRVGGKKFEDEIVSFFESALAPKS